MTTLFGDLAGDLTGEPGRTPPLVLLHGLTFDRTSWHPVLAELTALDPGGPVLALDLPGHGESPPWPGYDLEPIADAVHRHDCLIMSQLTHLGRRAQSDVESWHVLLAPSQLPEKVHREVPHEMELEQIEERIFEGEPGADARANIQALYKLKHKGMIVRHAVEPLIEAALAFGTGHHGTTRGCLLALDRLLKQHRPQRVLDIIAGRSR